MRRATPEERGQAIKEIGESLSALESAFDFDQSKEVQAERLDEFHALPLDEQARAMETTQRVFMGILAVVHDQLSIMVHGEKLSALVSPAKAGDDEAFLKAIQIDKRILSKVPYFDARFLRAHMQARPHIVARIEAGDIALHQQVGNQRRVLKSAVETWQRRDQARRRRALGRLGADLDAEIFAR